MKALKRINFKRLCALFLALSMVFGCMSLEAFAENEERQASVSTTQNGVTLTKTVSEQKEDGSYDLTIEAFATGATTLKHEAMDIVLVLDTSGSMDENLDVGGGYSAQEDNFSYNDVVGNNYYVEDGDSYYEVMGVANQSGLASSYCYLYYDKGSTRYYLSGSSLIQAKDQSNPTYSCTLLGYESGTKAKDASGNTIEPAYGKYANIYTGTLYHYSNSNMRKLAALKSTVTSFIDAVEKDAKEYGTDHRIAIVEFASSAYTRKGLTSVNGNAAALKSTINDFVKGGATRADRGMSAAYDLLQNSASAHKVVIFVTDGGPTEGSTTARFFESGHYDSEAVGKANNTIGYANQIKGLDGAEIYSVGIFEEETYSVKTFLEAVSSNYPTASAMDNLGTEYADNYYKTVTNSASLNNMFNSICTEIISTDSILGASSVLTDEITLFFELKKEPTVQIAKRTVDGSWSEAQSAGDGVTAVYDPATHSVQVTGFDYVSADNLVVNTTSGWQGRKLVITCNLKLAEGAELEPGENWLKTNEKIDISIDDVPAIEMTDSPEAEVEAYAVTYSWTGLPENETYKAPAEKAYLEGAAVTVDTVYTKGKVVQVEGKYYEFSGWDVTKDFAMGTEDVEIKGSWKPATRDYTINYYKQDKAEPSKYEDYTLVTDDTETGTAEVGTQFYPGISTGTAADYSAKYEEDNYSYAYGDTSAEMKADQPNVLNLYYNKLTTSYTVNRTFHLHIIDETGAERDVDPVTLSDAPVEGYVGEKAQITPETTYDGPSDITYDLNEGTTSPQTIEALDKVAENNVFNLDYYATQDLRAKTTVKVKHVYHSFEYVLDENGKYGAAPEETFTSEKLDSNPVNNNTYKATTTYTASAAEKTPLAAYEGYTLREDAEDSIKLDKDAAKNVIVLDFDKAAAPLTAASVTVNHHYTKTVTYIDDNGKVQTKTEPDDHIETVTVSTGIYVGEKFTAAEVNAYDGTTYTSDEGNASRKVIAALAEGENVINLYYTASEAPKQVSVTVIHSYFDVIDETVAVTSDEGAITGTTVKTRVEEVASLTKTEEPVTCYVGQSFTAGFNGVENYTFKADQSDPQTITVSENGNIVNLKYFSYDTGDNRVAASIDVVHRYTTHLETIVEGEVKTVDITESKTDQACEGKAGDSFTAVPETKFGGYDGWTVIGTPDLGRVLHSGTNDSVVIEYERDDSDLVDTTYTVNYIYKHNQQFINGSGVAEMRVVIDKEIPGTADGYVGQSVSFSDGARSGYSIVGTAPATTQILKADSEENVWTFEYIRDEDELLGDATVTVNHHYTTFIINESGVKDSGSTQDVFGTAVEKVNGESFTAETAPDGFDYIRYAITTGVEAAQDETSKAVSFTANGDITVDFYYEKTVDYSVPVTYTITDVYKTYTWDGKELIEAQSTTYTRPSVSTFMGVEIQAEPAFTGNWQTVDSASFNEDEIKNAPYTAVMTYGTNEFVFVYKYCLPRADVAVSVIHNYYHDAEKAEALETEAVVEDNTGKCQEDDWFTAEPVTANAGLEYKFYAADPADYKVYVEKDGSYVIIIDYIRAVRTVTIKVVDENEEPVIDENGEPVIIEIEVPYGDEYDITSEDIADQIPEGYIPSEDFEIKGTITGDVEETVMYYTDKKGGEDEETGEETGDGVPDIFQVYVSFLVINGTWVGETETTVTVKYDMASKDAATGKWVEKDTRLGDTIPSGRPNNGCSSPAWDTEPTADTKPVDKTVYTLRYSRNIHNVIVIPVDENGEPIEDAATNTIPTEYGDTYKVTEDDLPEVPGYTPDMQPDEGEGTMGDEDVVANITYEKDVIGGTDPETGDDKGDGIPDKYQAIVEFKVVNGKWTSDEEEVPLRRIYTLKEKNADTKVWTDIEGVVIGTIPTHEGNTGYKTGSWDVLPKADDRPAAGITVYTFTYEKGEYTVTYYVDGVKIGDSTPTVFGTIVTVKDEPTKTGYTFSGWTVEGAEPENGEFSMPANDVVISGTFTVSKHDVIVKVVDENGDPILDDNGEPIVIVIEDVPYGDDFSDEVNEKLPDIPGYTPTELEGENILDKDNDIEITVTYEHDKYFFALYYYDGYNRDCKPVDDDENAVLKKTALTEYSFTVDGNMFTRRGYSFKGWAVSFGGETKYAPGNSLTLPVEMVTVIQLMSAKTSDNEMSLYAVWERIPEPEDDDDDILVIKEPAVEEPVAEEPVEIEEPETPLAEMPVEDPEIEDLFEEEVPLASVPETGDSYTVWAFLSFAMALLMGVMELIRKKRTEC